MPRARSFPRDRSIPAVLRRPLIAVVSPFLDKQHGTELCVAEQIERLSAGYDIHLYSENVQGVNLTGITWHRVWVPPGPHLLRFGWWFAANQICRWWDRKVRRLIPELVYSPGVNCLDADLIGVHILFAKMRRELAEELRLMHNSVRAWPVLIHRKSYYLLIEWLENLVYRQNNVALAAVSRLVAQDIDRFHGRQDNVSVVYHGIDTGKFSSCRRRDLRPAARADLGLPETAFAVLLIGNDWKKKGLSCLLEAAGRLRNQQLHIFVAGTDSQTPYQSMIRRLDLSDHVHFLPPRSDVEFYYAAADAYVGPSLEDAFSLPPAEAMACGLPVITTRLAGVSEIIHHSVDGLILENPTDAELLSTWLGRLSTDREWCSNLGNAAAQTAKQYTWDRNAEQMRALFERVRQHGISR
jgi:glycosyltransferase involved in cell wall biosynthesis